MILQVVAEFFWINADTIFCAVNLVAPTTLYVFLPAAIKWIWLHSNRRTCPTKRATQTNEKKCALSDELMTL